MEFINNIYFNALGLTLLHSLWQGILIGLIFFIAKNIFHKHPARLRFQIGAFSLIAQFVFSLATFMILIDTFSAPISAINPQFSPTQILILGPTESINNFPFWLSIVGILWLGGTLFCLARLSTGWWQTKQLKSKATPLAAQWQRLTNSLAIKMGMEKKIAVLSAVNIHVPFTIGFLKPVILFPIGMVNQLNAVEVEAILAHELAHIKYQDYILNLIFSTIEALFYFHPVMWWISSEINDAREESCDELAIKILGDRMQYAKTLIRVQEESNFYLNTGLALSGKKGHLTQRIHKILNMPQTKNKDSQKFFGFVLVGIVASLFWIGSLNANSPEANAHLQMETEAIEDIAIEEKANEKIIYVKMIENEHNQANEAHQDIRIAAHAQNEFESSTGIDEIRIQVPKDTVPDQKQQVTITRNKDGRKDKVKMRNNKITFLMLDGKVIPEEDYDKYTDEVEAFLNATPPPPPPPPAPIRAPKGTMPPAPPAPPMPHSPPAAPIAPEIDLSYLEQLKDLDFSHLNFEFDNFDFSALEQLKTLEFDFDGLLDELTNDSARIVINSDAFNNFDFEEFADDLRLQLDLQEKVQIELEEFQLEHQEKLENFWEDHEAEMEKLQFLLQEEFQNEWKENAEVHRERIKRMKKQLKQKEEKMKELKSKMKDKRKSRKQI